MAAVTGGCLCSQVRFRCDEPVEKLVLCHCRACRFISGGAPNAAALVKVDAFHLTGKTAGYTSTGGSGQAMTRHFCPACGTPIYTELSARPEVIALKAGALDDQSSLVVAALIWTASAEPWHDLPPDVPRFPQGFPQKPG